MNKKIKNRFTLVELLVVMGLMALMISLAVPAFSRMTKNNEADVMASSIKTALEQGQSTAVGKNCYVAVIFPLSSTKNNVKAYNYGGYRVAEVVSADPDKDGENVTSSSYKFKRWISESYTNAPGDALMVADGNSKVTEVSETVKAGNFSKMQALAGTTGDANSENALAGCKAVIFKPTGECVNEDMYISIAVADSKNLKVFNTSDFRQLYLNQFTGRVEYVTDEDTTSGGGE